MKKMIILIALAGLMAGCAARTENSTGAGGYYEGGGAGSDTNNATLDKSTVPDF
jgi:hypothetical protein